MGLKTQAAVELDHFELYSAKLMDFFSNPVLWIILGGLLLLVIGYIYLAYRLNHPKKKKTPAKETGGRIRMTGSEDDD